MTPQPVDHRNKAVTAFWLTGRALKSAMRDQTGVTAIEYALLAALIAVAAVGSITLLGTGLDDLWTQISAKVAASIGGAL